MTSFWHILPSKNETSSIRARQMLLSIVGP